jgi:hypothetical protein
MSRLAYRNAKNQFALYILVLFKPWNIITGIPDGRLDWQGFCEFIAHLAQSKNTNDHSVLQTIRNIQHNLKTRYWMKKTLMRWRNRSVKSWNE